ncbi:plasmid mobilization protein MobA [Pseudomonas fulva]|uniref:plasmid mobilization protein MobA n=1 Tax=Pseudomonas fulva TaxID=47880 RepID=UPI002DB724B9|nr:plasmid mobilization protein MobA [Pseudomonas fulva]MEB8059299.1 mobilization protein [Pseudomonas fulva]
MSKSKARSATSRIEIRCTEADKAKLKAKAEAAGINLTDLMLRAALGKKIQTRTDTRLMNEMLRLGGLQKHLHNQMKDQMTQELSRQFSEVLVALKKAVIAIDLQTVEVLE